MGLICTYVNYYYSLSKEVQSIFVRLSRFCGLKGAGVAHTLHGYHGRQKSSDTYGYPLMFTLVFKARLFSLYELLKKGFILSVAGDDKQHEVTM